MAGPVAVIGAGPHGLAATAHLRAAGLDVRCFGEPLEFWREHMPAGMLLRSRKRATHIADPARALTIERYEQAHGRTLSHPSLTLEEFIDYAMWFQHQAVPDLDRRKVVAVTREDGRFGLALSDGENIATGRVVVAAGVEPFAYHPPVFAELPASSVSHSFDHVDLGVFAVRRVAVVGAGQSALESAALLVEAGAEVELLIRAPLIHWLWGGNLDEPGPEPNPRVISPPTHVGGGVRGWIAAAPDVFRRMPAPLQDATAYRCNRPAGSGWLRPRLRRAAISMQRSVVVAEPNGDGVRLQLDDGSERLVDHVLLGTGYAVDVARYPFMTASVTSELATVNGYPRLRAGLESSVPGLHFVGAPAAMTFGPVMRFVVGTWYTAPAVARQAGGRRQRPIKLAWSSGPDSISSSSNSPTHSRPLTSAWTFSTSPGAGRIVSEKHTAPASRGHVRA